MLPATVTLNPREDSPNPLPEAPGGPAPQHQPHVTPSTRPREPAAARLQAQGKGELVFVSQNQNSLLLAETFCCREPTRRRPDGPQCSKGSYGGRCLELTVLCSQTNMSPKEKVMFCKQPGRSVITERAAATHPTSCY